MREFIGKTMALARPYRGRLALGVLFGILAGLASPLLILSIKLVFDVVFPGADQTELEKWQEALKNAPIFIQKLAAAMNDWLHSTHDRPSNGVILLAISTVPLAMLLRGVFGYLNSYFLQWVGVRAVTDLRKQLFAHLNSLSLSFFHQTSTGELMSRISNDTSVLQGAITNNVAVLAKEPVTVISVLCYLFWKQPHLTVLVVLVFPICMVPLTVYARKVRKGSAAIQEQYVELSKIMHETFTGNRVIKAYNLEAAVEKQFSTSATGFIHHFMRVVRSLELPGPMIEFVGSVGVAFILIYVAFWSKVQMKQSDFLAFIIAIFTLYQPIKALTRLYHSMVQARASSERVFELLATKSTVAEPANPVPLKAAGADIHFDQLTFGYGEKTVLQDIRLTVRAGTLVALVGHTGSGKTTLTNLLLRFYDPNQGTIRIGDTDIRQVSLHDLRGQMAVVTQETILFNDTIRNNIALGRPGATEAEIVAAAKHANAHEFIIERPAGYDAQIGEKGGGLSGGQRQRLAIARAIVKDAPILLLDEATNALDTEMERAVQVALDELMKGRTTICIAHRLSTTQHANLIVVLDQGRIVETGTHAELFALGGIYHKLYSLQFPP